MPVTASAIIAGTGLAGSLLGGSKSSKGAAAAGQAEAQTAANGLAASQQARTTAYNLASSAAIPSAQELNLMDQTVSNSMSQLQAQSNAINTATQTLNSLSPAVKAAGDNATALLNGQTSSMLKPLQNQQQVQRTQLQNQLASKLGPGYQTTAAGIMALNNFDNNAASTMANAQSQALNQAVSATSSLAGLSGNLSSNISQNANSTASLANNMQTTQQQFGIQAANIYAGGSAQALSANNTLASVVGNQFAGQISQGQNLSNLFGNVGQVGVSTGVGSFLSSGSGSSSPDTSALDTPNFFSGSSMPSAAPAGGGYTLGSFT